MYEVCKKLGKIEKYCVRIVLQNSINKNLIVFNYFIYDSQLQYYHGCIDISICICSIITFMQES